MCCDSPFSQSLQAAHAAQDELGVLVLVHVDLLVIRHQGVLPVMQLLVPGGLDFLSNDTVTRKIRFYEVMSGTCIHSPYNVHGIYLLYEYND